MTMDRRAFITRGGAALALAGPFAGLLARAAGAAAPSAAATDLGYGPLVPAVDATTGETLLRLPAGFRYRTFGEVGSTMTDGLVSPTNPDGMDAFQWRGGRLRLVRNHETFGPGLPGRPPSEFGFPSGDPQGSQAQPGTNPYDPTCRGGTTTLEVDLRHDDEWGEVRSWVSMTGTYFNCSGGPSVYGTWFSCEESPSGPDIGSLTAISGGDLFSNGRWNLPRKHGYVYEVDSRWGPGEAPQPTPITQAGRFCHEGAVMDPATGYLYLTEDNFVRPSGLYRYLPPNDPRIDTRVEDGGTLQMLRVVGVHQATLFSHQEPGASFPVDWVTIPEPDPTYPPGIAWLATLATPDRVGGQGIAQGAAQFSRLEGIRRVGRRIYFSSTQGGQGREGASSTFGPGFGQLWMLDLAQMTLHLVFEAPPRPDPSLPVGPGNLPALNLPDNLAISPRGALVVCEDGTIDSPERGYVVESNFLRGLTRDGQLFAFAENIDTTAEFTGPAFSPDGKSLFFNIQNAEQPSPGRTFEVRGPFHRGPW
jgi:secreted PhoX family phosphatase